jgi:hypothetical protein
LATLWRFVYRLGTWPLKKAASIPVQIFEPTAAILAALGAAALLIFRRRFPPDESK